MENKYSNIDLINDYVDGITERINTTPEMIINSKDKWMIVKNTDENLVKLDNFLNKTEQEIPEDVKVYLNSPEEYDKIFEGINLRAKLKEEREEQERINNPEIDEDIKNIDSKDKLFDFLLEEFHSNKEALIWEFSTMHEEDEAKLKAEYNELVRLKEKYLN